MCTEWWMMGKQFKAEKATPGGLAACTLYLSQRHLDLICWSHCQQAPVFLALTCEWPWKFWQTAKQAVSSGVPPAFLWRLLRTVHRVALSHICILHAPTFMVQVRSPMTRQYTFLLNPIFWCFGGLIQLSPGVFLIKPCMSACASSNAIRSEVTFLPWFNLRTDSILSAIISFSVSPEQKSVWQWLRSPLPRHSLGSHWMIFQLSVRWCEGNHLSLVQAGWLCYFPQAVSFIRYIYIFFVCFSVHLTEFILSTTAVFK